MDRQPEGPTLWHIYHSLWGKAKDTPGYRKASWNQLHGEMAANQNVRGECSLRWEAVELARHQGVSEDEIQATLKEQDLAAAR